MAKKKKAVEEEAEMNMTPMIDVTFQLLIFFIVTMKFRLLEKKLNSYLPTDFGTNVTPQIVDELFITVKMKQPKSEPGPIRERSTHYFVETERIKGSDQEIHDNIYRKISKFRTDQKDAKGKIEAGLGVPHGKVVKVLDMFHRAGFKTITFVGLAANKSIVQGNKMWNKVRKDLGDI